MTRCSISVGVFRLALLCLAAGLVSSAVAAEFKYVTEYRYPTRYEVTPIYGAGINGNQTVVGAIVTPTDFEMREVGVYLHVVAEVGELAGAAAMFNGGQMINANTPLMAAAAAGDLNTARRLLAQGASVNARNSFGSTALFGAAAGGFDRIVKVLADNNADVSAKSSRGDTPLAFAAKNGHLSVVKTLLAKGADINAADASGMTALMHAVNNGHADVSQYLAGKGASLDVRDSRGRTPLMLAQASENQSMVLLLMRLGARK